MVVGDPGVGRATLIKRAVEDNGQVYHDLEEAQGFKWSDMSMDVSDKYYCRLIIWDASSKERWKNVVRSLYSKTHVAIVMYDVTNQLTFDRFGDHLKGIREMLKKRDPDKGENCLFYVVGNKADINDYRRAVPEEDGRNSVFMMNFFDDKLGCKFFETSAKDGTNVKELFKDICDSLYAQHKRIDKALYDIGTEIGDIARELKEDYQKEKDELYGKDPDMGTHNETIDFPEPALADEKELKRLLKEYNFSTYDAKNRWG